MRLVQNQKQYRGSSRSDRKHTGGKIGVLQHRGAYAKILCVLWIFGIPLVLLHKVFAFALELT